MVRVASQTHLILDLQQRLLKELFDHSQQWRQQGNEPHDWRLREEWFDVVGGDAYRAVPHGELVFWKHLRWLSRGGYAPSFTSKDLKGKRVCYRTSKGFTTMWCRACQRGEPGCENCHEVARFKILGENKCYAYPKSIHEFPLKIDVGIKKTTTPFIPKSWKGRAFSSFIIPIILQNNQRNDGGKKRILSYKLEDILRNSFEQGDKRRNDMFECILAVLNHEYGFVSLLPENRRRQIWIAPTSQANMNTSLNQTLVLCGHTTLGIAHGTYHVWGFNDADAKRWHTIQPQDVVIFGNAASGFCKIGLVQHKFIWLKEQECVTTSNNSNTSAQLFPTQPRKQDDMWRYGYTLCMANFDFELPREDIMLVSKGHFFERQTKLKPAARKLCFARIKSALVQLDAQQQQEKENNNGNNIKNQVACKCFDEEAPEEQKKSPALMLQNDDSVSTPSENKEAKNVPCKRPTRIPKKDDANYTRKKQKITTTTMSSFSYQHVVTHESNDDVVDENHHLYEAVDALFELVQQTCPNHPMFL